MGTADVLGKTREEGIQRDAHEESAGRQHCHSVRQPSRPAPPRSTGRALLARAAAALLVLVVQLDRGVRELAGGDAPPHPRHRTHGTVSMAKAASDWPRRTCSCRTSESMPTPMWRGQGHPRPQKKKTRTQSAGVSNRAPGPGPGPPPATYAYTSSVSCARAFLATVWKACSTLMFSLAEVSKYGMLPLDWHQVMARFWKTMRLLSSTSTLLPSTTKGKFSGSRGDAWMRNSSRHESSVSNDLTLLTSNTSTHASAPR